MIEREVKMERGEEKKSVASMIDDAAGGFYRPVSIKDVKKCLEDLGGVVGKGEELLLCSRG